MRLYARWEKEGGYKAAPDILKRGVSAVFCMSDSIAGGLYEYMREHDIAVGKDISVAGYDDQNALSITGECGRSMTVIDVGESFMSSSSVSSFP